MSDRRNNDRRMGDRRKGDRRDQNTDISLNKKTLIIAGVVVVLIIGAIVFFGMKEIKELKLQLNEYEENYLYEEEYDDSDSVEDEELSIDDETITE